MIRVEIVKPTPREIRPFIHLAEQIYRQDSNWVAPDRREMMRLLTGKDNEFFAQGIQRFFLAYEDDKPVARVLAGIDVRRNAQTGLSEGYFSLFESYDNMDYARAVLDAAVAFLKEHGVTRLTGPVAPMYTDMNRGLLVQGFDGPPVLFNPYNPEYYANLLEDYGFRKDRDFFAYQFNIHELQEMRFAPLSGRVQRRFGFKARNIDLNKESIARVSRDIAMVIAEATPEETGQYLPTTEDIMDMLRRIKPVFRSNLAVIAYAGDRPIGVLLGLLDYSRIMRVRRGRRNPIAWIRGLAEVPRIDTARCPVQCVVPEYQNKAVNAVLYYRAVQGAKKLGIKMIEGSTVDETHVATINNTLMAGGKLYRVYRRYQMAI
jgi:GNAT superfamily N-acetyltransferase